ncbi:MAG: hypothetical protein WDM92_04720 [Caulobacteraceae bacterium]
MQIADGQETATPTGELFSFENNGYRYTLDVGLPKQPPHEGLIVVKGGQQVSAEPLIAYEVAPKP